MDVKDFNYELPEELIAQDPVPRRDESRLLILNKETGEFRHSIFREIIHTKTVTKTALPDVTAQIFWLKNRRPDKWREKQDVQVNAEPVRIVIDV